MTDKVSKKGICVIILIVAIGAIAGRTVFGIIRPFIMPPSYSAGMNRTVYDKKKDVTARQRNRKVTVSKGDKVIWNLEKNVLAQSVLLADIDHDDDKELIILCWKRGRFGKHRPSWVKHDEITWSQHIFIYETEDTVRPKWMASDIGPAASKMEFSDGALIITGTDGAVTKWVWLGWGLTKM